MAVTLFSEKGAPLTIAEMDANMQVLKTLSEAGSSGIDDGVVSTESTWSSSKIQQSIVSQIDGGSANSVYTQDQVVDFGDVNG